MSRSIERTLSPSVLGTPTRSSKKEEATLRRVFGFVACASLLTAVPWWVNRGETAVPAQTRDAAGNAESSASSLSAGQLFLQGRQDYLAGRFAEAVVELEAASRASGDLTDSDRERLPGWLAQARAKATGSKATGTKDTGSKKHPAPESKPAEAAAKTETVKTEGAKVEAATPDAAPSKQGMGEGQKPVSQAYKDNWNAIFGTKKKKKR